jgi:hypothetical protein
MVPCRRATHSGRRDTMRVTAAVLYEVKKPVVVEEVKRSVIVYP